MTYIVRVTKKKGRWTTIFIDQPFNNKKDAKKFAELVKGRIFKIKGNKTFTC